MSGLVESDLLGLVGEVLTAERAVPASWRESAQAAYTWRTVDGELLALSYDSRDELATAVRGESAGLCLEFTGSTGLTLEVELSDRGLLGQVTGPLVGDVVLEEADGGRRAMATDGSGFFTLEGEARGPVRFVVGSGPTRLVTDWVVL